MKILMCWCSNPTGGKLIAEINLSFTTKQYKHCQLCVIMEELYLPIKVTMQDFVILNIKF